MTVEKICGAMIAAEKEVAELLLHAHGILAETKTGKRDVVTEYDRRVQLLLEAKMRELLPQARFFCEELNEQGELGAEHVFIIDPIDGTMNFVRGFNHSCISMAYCTGGVLTAAAVYNPYMDELFSACAGKGAFLNGRPIRVDDVPLNECVACYGTAPYAQGEAGKTFRLAEKVYLASLDLRRQGSAELDLCSVAAGRAGLYFEMSVSLWDYAAGALIVEEAGGKCFTADGAPLPFTGAKTSIAAGGQKELADFFKLV